MVKYVTEPRSRPTSPLDFSPPVSPTPPFQRNEPMRSSTRSEDTMPQRWISSSRCGRRASSPHRTLVETSFCGHKTMQVPHDMQVEPRGPSPLPSLGSTLSVNSVAVKYVTEPRSRPASPPRAYLETPGMPDGSRRGSRGSMRCLSPNRMKVETSFCGSRQIVRKQSQEGFEPTLKGTRFTLSVMMYSSMVIELYSCTMVIPKPYKCY